jgi:hypothetical protein
VVREVLLPQPLADEALRLQPVELRHAP